MLSHLKKTECEKSLRYLTNNEYLPYWWICNFTIHRGASVWLAALLGQKSSPAILLFCNLLFGQLQLAACLGGVLKFHRFMGSAIYLWNMSISLSNWRMACVVWVRVLTKSGDGERVPRGLKIPIRWAKIPAVGKRTTTAPLLHKSTGSTFDASTLLLLIHIASAFPMACVHPLPPWTLAVAALVQALHFTPADYQNLPDLRSTTTSPPDLHPPQETGPANWTTLQIPNWEMTTFWNNAAGSYSNGRGSVSKS